MFIQRLQWAGVKIQTDHTAILIDPVYGSPSAAFFGEPQEPFYPLSDFGPVDLIAITHLHTDHFDPEAIIATYGPFIPLLVPHESEQAAQNAGFKQVTGLKSGDFMYLRGAKITAVPAIDGLGDPQVAWIFQDEGKTVFHTGDTLWHGYWWGIEKELGPIDVACLPVNGAIVQEEGQIPSGQPICLTPEQAVSAAKVLKAKTMVPIHYGSFHHPPSYSQTEKLRDRLNQSATANHVRVSWLNHKEWIKI